MVTLTGKRNKLMVFILVLHLAAVHLRSLSFGVIPFLIPPVFLCVILKAG